MIAPGQRLPRDLPLKIIRAGRIEITTLGAQLTRRTVVSVFMRPSTSSCDRQVASLAQAAPLIEELGCNLVALSRDTGAALVRYGATLGLGFDLISDPEFSFSRAADALVEKSMYGRKFIAPARAAYVLDPDGTVGAVIAPVDLRDHGAQVAATLAALAALAR